MRHMLPGPPAPHEFPAVRSLSAFGSPLCLARPHNVTSARTCKVAESTGGWRIHGFAGTGTLSCTYVPDEHVQHLCPRVLSMACPGFLTVADIKGNVTATRGVRRRESHTHLMSGQARLIKLMQDSRCPRKSELIVGLPRSKARIVKPSSPINSEPLVHATSCSNV